MITLNDPHFLETPEIRALRVALATAPEAERPDAQAALDRAIALHDESVLDILTDHIVEKVQVLEAAIFNLTVEEASKELRSCVDLFVTHFSVREHHMSKRRDIPRGMLLSDAARSGGRLGRLPQPGHRGAVR